MVQKLKIEISLPPHPQFIPTTSLTFSALLTTVIIFSGSFQRFSVHMQANMNQSMYLFIQQIIKYSRQETPKHFLSERLHSGWNRQ